MIKIQLKDGIVIEVETAADAVQILQGDTKKSVQEGVRYVGVCTICGKLLEAGTKKKKLCGSNQCLKAYYRAYTKKYYSNPVNKAKNRKLAREWAERHKKPVNIAQDIPEEVPF